MLPKAGSELEQIDPQHPCGLVSIVVVTSALGSPVEQDQVEKVIAIDGLGRTSMAELIRGLRSLGFASAGIKLETSTLRHLAGKPLILHVRPSHFLVAVPVGDGSVVLIDPPHAASCVTLDTLALRWSGETIIVQKDTEDLRMVMKSLGLDDDVAVFSN